MDWQSLQLRRQRLRLPIRDLAARARLDQMNVSRVLRGATDARSSTLRALDVALRHEEQELKAYLDDLLGAPPMADPNHEAAA